MPSPSMTASRYVSIDPPSPSGPARGNVPDSCRRMVGPHRPYTRPAHEPGPRANVWRRSGARCWPRRPRRRSARAPPAAPWPRARATVPAASGRRPPARAPPRPSRHPTRRPGRPGDEPSADAMPATAGTSRSCSRTPASPTWLGIGLLARRRLSGPVVVRAGHRPPRVAAPAGRRGRAARAAPPARRGRVGALCGRPAHGRGRRSCPRGHPAGVTPWTDRDRCRLCVPGHRLPASCPGRWLRLAGHGRGCGARPRPGTARAWPAARLTRRHRPHPARAAARRRRTAPRPGSRPNART